MDNRRFSRQTILVLTKDVRLFLPVKAEIEKEGMSVRFAGSVHEAAVAALLTDPVLVAVELSPGDFSGLGLLPALEGLRPSGTPLRYFFYSFRESHHGFLHLYDQIHFLDEKGVQPVVEKIKALLSIPPSSWQRGQESKFDVNESQERDLNHNDTEIQMVQSGINNRPPDFKQGAGRDSSLLEKLDRLGVIRKK